MNLTMSNVVKKGVSSGSSSSRQVVTVRETSSPNDRKGSALLSVLESKFKGKTIILNNSRK